MRVVLKSAGLLAVGGVLGLLATAVVVKSQQANLNKIPELAPIEGFRSKAKVDNNKGAAIFDSKADMAPINLTEHGKTDWIVWGVDTSRVIRKAADKPVISDYTLLDPENKVLDPGKRGPSRGLVWSNGSPVEKTNVSYGGVHVTGTNGFRFEVPATAETQRLRVFVGGFKAGGAFKATLTDNTPVVIKREDIALGEGYYSRTYTVEFKSDKPGQKLEVIWSTSGSTTNNVSLQAAALE